MRRACRSDPYDDQPDPLRVCSGRLPGSFQREQEIHASTPTPTSSIRLKPAASSARAATAIGGGIALAAGLEAQRFPPEWLEGTPFRGYVAPGALLATAVGGSAALATVATIRDARAGGVASVLAGSIMVGWILGEVAMLRDGGPRVSKTEAAYLTAGLAMAGIGLLLARR